MHRHLGVHISKVLCTVTVGRGDRKLFTRYSSHGSTACPVAWSFMELLELFSCNRESWASDCIDSPVFGLQRWQVKSATMDKWKEEQVRKTAAIRVI